MAGHRPLRQRVPEEAASDSVSLDRLFELAELLGAMAQRGVAEHGLTRALTAPLWTLFHDGPMTQRAPAARLGVIPRSVTGLLHALETDGLAARAAHPADRRAKLVSLTDRGRTLTAGLRSGRVEPARELFGYICSETLVRTGDVGIRKC
ncbi:MarR family transcriptional regulator [Streptomyces sp. SA15]|uniref:MarR family winged helix-turn-helix transcriptional regulator n=1 Tax=Streptomyces sp. SA15 TaxID=934019 RepID=UPI000BAFDF19|nr:MarR family transcriptional regulator [Streptomyces sp. SA15]PAZ16460.1 MarR family transcriptional regulator [Streptomyces sp. SA15]